MILTKNNIDNFCLVISCLINNEDEEKYMGILLSFLNNNSSIAEKLKKHDKKSNDVIISALLNNLDYDSSLSFDEVIKKIKNSFKPENNKIYEVYFDTLIDKYTKLNVNDQLLYINDFLDLLLNTFPQNVKELFSDLNPDVQLKAFDVLFNYYKTHPSYVMFWDLLGKTSKEVLEKKYTKELFELELNNKNVLNVPENFFVDNMRYVIKKAIEANKFYELFEGSKIERVRNYFAEIMDIVDDDLTSIDTFFEIYIDSKNTYEVVAKVTIEEMKASNELYRKYLPEKLIELAIDNCYTSIIEVLLRANKSLHINFGNDLKLKLFDFLMRNSYINIEISDILDEDFITQNINIIMQKILEKRDFTLTQNILYTSRSLQASMLNDDIREKLEVQSLEYCRAHGFKYIEDVFKFYRDDTMKKVINEVIVSLLNNNYPSDYELSLIFASCSNDVLQSIRLELYELIVQKVENFGTIIKYFPEKYQLQILNKIIKSNNYQHIAYELSKMPKELVTKYFYLFNNNQYPDAKIAYLNFLEPSEINDNLLKELLNVDNCTSETLEMRIKNYKELLISNIDLNKTINPLILDDKVYKLLGKKIIMRIVIYPKFQNKMLDYTNNDIYLYLIKFIADNYDNYVDMIDYGFDNAGINIFSNSAFEVYVSRVGKVPINKEMLENCFKLCELSNTYIENLSLSCIDDSIFNEGLAIIKGEKRIFNFYNGEKNIDFDTLKKYERERYALCLILFGTTYSNVIRLVNRYGLYLENIDFEELDNNDKKSFNTLKLMKNIMSASNYDELISDILANEEKYRQRENSCFVLEYEYNLKKMFKHLYKKKILKVHSNARIIKVDDDAKFYMIVRREGAYDPSWVEPENYLEAINRPNYTYHGNCKSLISNDFLSMANSKGPIYGYNNVDLQLCAPFDISSNKANKEFSISNNNHENLAFMDPKTLINRTRHNHNEIVSDRLIYDKKTDTYKKDTPDYLIWLNDDDIIDHEKLMHDPSFISTVKASKDIGIPIVFINRVKIIELNEQKLLQNLEKLENFGNNSNIFSLINYIVVNFYNNRAAIQLVESLKSRYFTDEIQSRIFTTFNNLFEYYKNNNYDLYKELLNYLITIISDEISKGYDAKNHKIKSVDNSYLIGQLQTLKSKQKEVIVRNNGVKSQNV